LFDSSSKNRLLKGKLREKHRKKVIIARRISIKRKNPMRNINFKIERKKITLKALTAPPFCIGSVNER